MVVGTCVITEDMEVVVGVVDVVDVVLALVGAVVVAGDVEAEALLDDDDGAVDVEGVVVVDGAVEAVG